MNNLYGPGDDEPSRLNVPTQPDPLAEALTDEDVCPKCLAELDTGWECNECGYDARPHVRFDD